MALAPSERDQLQVKIESESKVSMKLESFNPKIYFTLSSLYEQKECVDFFLTRQDESLSTFLEFSTELQINFHAASNQVRDKRRTRKSKIERFSLNACLTH